MVKLNKLMSNSRASEVYSAANRMILEFKTGDWSTETKLTSIFNEIEPLNISLEKAINQEKAISDLEVKDEIRDGLVQNIYYTIKGFLHSPLASFKNAAEAVDAIFSRYGLEIINQSYSVESGFVKSMLSEFSGAEIQTSIDALPGLRDLINSLITAQTDFETARVAYDKASASDKSKESATEIKKQVLASVNDKLVAYLKIMSIMDESTYGILADTVSKIIDDNNEQVKKRRKKPTAELNTNN